MPLQYLIPGGLALGGFLGDLFSGSDDEQSDRLLKLLQKNAEQGAGVSKLAAPELQGITRRADQATTQQRKQLGRAGLGSTSQATSGAANIFQRAGAQRGGAYARATAQNEQIKNRARAMMLQMLGQRYQQQPGFGALAGAGVQGLLRSLYNSTEGNTGGGTGLDIPKIDAGYKVPKYSIEDFFRR